MIKTLVTNREWGKFSHTQVASAVKACLGRTEVAKRLLFISFAVVASFVGQTVHAQNAAWDATTTPSAADGQEVYLYNVGTKQFLGRGGRWGTEANMNVEGAKFTLTYNSSAKSFTLTSPMRSGNGDKLTLMDGVNSAHDEGTYFLDQGGANFSVTEVKSGDELKGYKISSVAANNGKYGILTKGETYNMVAFGVYQKAYAKLATEDWVNGDSTDYATWIIVTHDQRLAAFGNVNDAHKAAVNATFLMHDFDFARNDYDCSYWRTGATNTGTTTGTLKMGNDKIYLPSDAYVEKTKTYVYKTEKHVYTSSYGGLLTSEHEDVIESPTPLNNVTEVGGTFTQKCSQNSSHTGSYKDKTYTYTLTEISETGGGYTYYLGNGYDENDHSGLDPITGETMELTENRQQTYGGAWTANIHGARGTVVQTIKAGNMVKEGWYRVSCVGFTTTTKGIARLFAASGKGNTGSNATALTEKFAIASLHRIDAATRPATYVAASKLLDTPNVNTFDASVKVYVSKTIEAETPYETLSFGIQVGSAADPTQDADADAWTCFDNFKIEYLGTPTNEIILDEDQTDGGYIKAQAWDDNKTVQKSIVYLHRSMNADKWNSLVLPINLNVGQVKSIFGDQVHISKFVGAKADHPQRIVFDPITADRNDPDAIAIEAGKLYLVKPTAEGGMLKDQAVKTFNKDGYNISVKDYYTIVGVTFKKKSEIADNAYSGRVMGDTGSEEFGTKQQVQFVGTYVKCFDTNNIPANSYVLNGNNVGGTAGLWYYRTVTTNTKGFRGWLQSANDLPSKGFEYEIEGVVDQVNGDVTAIEGIEAAQQHSGNIYNLNGQLVRQGATSTEGLPSGLYIVGGKKVVVK
mgnify:CR=1 FL=1